jgi:hypothetical protein
LLTNETAPKKGLQNAAKESHSPLDRERDCEYGHYGRRCGRGHPSRSVDVARILGNLDPDEVILMVITAIWAALFLVGAWTIISYVLIM